MEKSLNSSRNFKLPPIQGALPAANILRQPTARKVQTWPRPHDHQRSSAALPPKHRSTVKPRPVIEVPKDPFPGRYRSPYVNRNLSNATLTAGQQRAFKAVRTIENEKNRESVTLEFAPLVHQFPQSYSVLPPIQKIQTPLANETGIAAQDKDSRCEEAKNSVDCKSVDDGKPNINKQKLDDPRKLQDKSGNSNTNNNSDSARNASKKKRRTDPENQDKETGERKPSATTVLFLKGKRKGRRVGVCLENEPALINVTEQLKEIFLRRNMEEMYLI